MAKTQLLDSDIEGARRLLKALVVAGIRLECAAWLRPVTEDLVHLYIVSSDIETKGPREVNKVLNREFSKLAPGLSFDIDDVQMVNSSHFSNIPLFALGVENGVMRGPSVTISRKRMAEAAFFDVDPQVLMAVPDLS